MMPDSTTDARNTALGLAWEHAEQADAMITQGMPSEQTAAVAAIAQAWAMIATAAATTNMARK